MTSQDQCGERQAQRRIDNDVRPNHGYKLPVSPLCIPRGQSTTRQGPVVRLQPITPQKFKILWSSLCDPEDVAFAGTACFTMQFLGMKQLAEPPPWITPGYTFTTLPSTDPSTVDISRTGMPLGLLRYALAEVESQIPFHVMSLY